MTASPPANTASAEFASTYTRHVDLVVAGNLKALLADMLPEKLPTVFEGINTPGKDVVSARIVSMATDGDRSVGEAVYTTESGVIGLRSGWGLVDGAWLADELENFEVPAP
ncbi:hypothetical protein [Kribbia dieselivorans]|uniref:hypothetical protein n=1 Tax=Kribbia dieselivorans TaxID=331526 RepID=UPI00083940BA|nr:hypothetical protein [Kribbia dieselivorans]